MLVNSRLKKCLDRGIVPALWWSISCAPLSGELFAKRYAINARTPIGIRLTARRIRRTEDFSRSTAGEITDRLREYELC
jgi:hypothetical protein